MSLNNRRNYAGYAVPKLVFPARGAAILGFTSAGWRYQRLNMNFEPTVL